MKTMMKHLNYLEEKSKTGKTKIITIFSKFDGTNLGEISWYGRWRQYVFTPSIKIKTVWSHDCLEELKNSIIQLNIEQKIKIK